MKWRPACAVMAVPRGLWSSVMMRRALLRSWALWALTGLLAFALAFAGEELRREFSRARAVRAEVEQSHQARHALQQTFSLMQDAETGHRGYVIAGETSFLQPYSDALTQLDPHLAQLRRLYADQPSQMADLGLLAELVAQKRLFMRETLEARDAEGREAGLQAVASGRGKSVMDQIRTVIDRMADRDARALEQVTNQADAQSRITERSATLLFVFLILVVSASVWLFLRYVRSRRTMLQNVRAAAARQEAIFDSAIDAIVTLNPSGTLETMNAAAVRMFGWTAEELGRRDVSVLLKPEDQASDTLMSWIRGAAVAESDGLIREARGQRRGGDSFPADVAFSPMPLPGGVHVVAVIRDISERRRVEQLKQQFVSTVSHELRTPLTSIAGSLGLLVGGAGGALPDRAARLIGIAHSNSQRLVRLINDILDVEKLESGQMLLANAALDMRDVAQRSLDSVAGVADSLGVHIRLEDGPLILPRFGGHPC